MSNRGSPRGVVGRQRADTTLHLRVSLAICFQVDYNQLGRLYLRREGRALSVLASWWALAAGWDVSWSLDTGGTARRSFDTRWPLMATRRFLACR